jgi:ABC-2 type transport system ATP-binding protein
MLYVNEVSKQYKQKIALSPISFEAQPGECIVLCGGNGAGKSTLIDILSGISTPTTGIVSYDEYTILRHRNEYLSKVAYMPDDFHAQNHLTVKEFMSFYGSLRKVDSLRIEEVLKQIGLEDKQHLLVKELSKGMRQRLIFGQSILADVDVLLLDEPTNGLDPYWIDRFIETISAIKEKGTIVIFSTHMMDVAAELGDRILFIENGEVVRDLINSHHNISEFTLELLKLHRQKV